LTNTAASRSADQWFDTFDKNDLAFLYQARKPDGEDSTFFKLVSHERAQ
jgi:hypothetical protein